MKSMTLKESIYQILTNVFILNNGVVSFYNSNKERKATFELAKNTKQEIEMLLGYNEAYQVCMAVKAVSKLEGDLAEVGVYKGGSAKLICEVKENKTLHLFDTFEGLPEISEFDVPGQVNKGDYPASLEWVEERLKQYPNVHLYKGLFPETTGTIQDKRFSFVNLDVDIYESTLAGLTFFYPRMVKGGIILSHDYISCPGVKKAIDEFFKDKKEPIIELSGSQCVIIKLEENKT